MHSSVKSTLEKIKKEINAEYGFYQGIPRINYGPCGVFAKIFFEKWNQLFDEKSHICFILTPAKDECDHIVVRLFSGELYDGGIGIHTDNKYLNKFLIDEMTDYDEHLLEKWSYGLDRAYPRFCPNFNREMVEKIVHSNLDELFKLIGSSPMNPTKHKEINELLQQLLTQVKSILADKLVGMYIGGSLSNDSFQYETSDIDCYIITTGKLSKSMLKSIEEMHKQFYSSKLKYAQKIEASYIPQEDLLHFNPNRMRPYFNEGCYYLGEYGNNYIIELHVLREKGITISGPDIKNLIKKISTQDLILAIQKNLHEYWEVTLSDLSKFKRSDYQVFAILTMCRTLYSLETGAITSKIEAAKWASQRFDRWKNLIEHAIAWNPGQELNKLDETQQFVKYTINKCQDY